MSSELRGRDTSGAEVARIDDTGIWLFIDGEELHLPFELFPWFRGVASCDVQNVERPSPDRLRWPALDIDLAVESIRFPDRFPLVSAVNGDR